MATVLDTLIGISAYPIPHRTLDGVAQGRGLTLSDNVTVDLLRGVAYNLARADLYLWLSTAPDISQGGQSYSFTDEQRADFRRRAYSLYGDYGDGADVTTPKTVYGYKGERL